MFKSLFSYKKPLFWFFFHIGLGLVSVFTPFPFIFYFYSFLFLSLRNIDFNKKVNSKLSFVIVYLVSFELLARISKTSPFIPYELGKYLLFFLLILGIYNGNNRGKIGMFMFIVLIPALFYDFSGKVIYQEIIFNLLGTFNIGLSVWYFYRQRFSVDGFRTLLILLLLPLLSVLTFTIISTPDLETIDFALTANFNTSGGFGSNQVSTILGYGMFLAFFMWLNGISFSGYKLLDMFTIILIGFQGLLTFSRGGMIGGAIAILIVLFYSEISERIKNRNSNKKIKLLYLVPLLFLILVSVFYANEVTNGNLFLRYNGETAGTLAGTKEKNLTTLTTNRFDLLLSDLELFYNNVFWGVGAASSKYLRNNLNGLTTHVEFSRLLAEHGILGLIFVFLIFICIYKVLVNKNHHMFRGFLFAIIVLGLYTSFHAATRTYISPLLIGLSLVFIQNDFVINSKKQITDLS